MKKIEVALDLLKASSSLVSQSSAMTVSQEFLMH
jgi:hypothetical protein